MQHSHNKIEFFKKLKITTGHLINFKMIL